MHFDPGPQADDRAASLERSEHPVLEGMLIPIERNRIWEAVLSYHCIQQLYPVPVRFLFPDADETLADWLRRHLSNASVDVMEDRQANVLDYSEWLLRSPFPRTLLASPRLLWINGLAGLFRQIDSGPFSIQPRSKDIPPVLACDAARDLNLLQAPPGEFGSGHGDRSQVLDPMPPLPALQIDSEPLGWQEGRRRLLDPERDPRDIRTDLLEAFPDVSAVECDGDPIHSGSHTAAVSEALACASAALPGPWHRPRRRSTGRILLLVHASSRVPGRLLDRFLDHYHRLGVDEFLLILHGGWEDPQEHLIRRILAEHDTVPVLEVDTFSAARKHRRFLSLMDQHCDPGDWVLLADVDEFQVYPDTLAHWLGWCDRNGYDFVRGRFLDRLAPDGHLAAIEPDGDLWRTFPFAARVTEHVTGGWSYKVCAMRGNLRPGEGGFHCLDYGADDYRNLFLTLRDPAAPRLEIDVHHFKWDASLRERLDAKLQVRRGDFDAVEGAGFIHEYERLARHINNAQRIAVAGMNRVGRPTIHYLRKSRVNPRSRGPATRADPAAPAGQHEGSKP